MVALPSETPVTAPLSTLAIEGADENQVIALESEAVAVKVTVLPTHTKAEVLEIETLGSKTVTAQLALYSTLSIVAFAVITAEPGATPVTTPPSTLAMEELEEDQVMALESEAVAVKVTVLPTHTEVEVLEIETPSKTPTESVDGVATPVEALL